MTLQRLADLAHVSVATVSKAFSGSKEISEETRQRIFAIARENNCFEKYHKGIYHKRVIAVIAPELRGEYYGAIITNLEQQIRVRGGAMTLSLNQFDAKNAYELFQYHAYYQKADGIILLDGNMDDIKNPDNIPAVIFSSAKGKEIDTVLVQMDQAVSQAVGYLKEMGHRRIAFIGETLTFRKKEIFLSAMQENGLYVNPSFVVTSEKRFEEAGYSIMETLLAAPSLPTAIIAAYDHIALGAICCIKSHGLRVPDDFSMIGMDNISVVSYLDVPLTSIRIEIESICDAMLNLLAAKMDNQYYRSRQVISVPCNLVKRQSVKKL